MNSSADNNITNFHTNFIDMGGLYQLSKSEFSDSISHPTNMVTNLDVPRPKCAISPIDDVSGLSLIPPINSIVSYEKEQKLIQNDSLFNQNSPTNNPFNINKPLKSILTVSSSNISQDSGCYSYENSLSSSPYYLLNESKFKNRNKNFLLDINKTIVQFQSTPNKYTLTQCEILSKTSKSEVLSNLKSKSRINFHSISDLAKSSSSFPMKTEDQFKNLNITNQSNLNSIKLDDDISKLSFNEQLQIMSNSLVNKENIHEFIYKVVFIFLFLMI
jgi:hypothetical protein